MGVGESPPHRRVSPVQLTPLKTGGVWLPRAHSSPCSTHWSADNTRDGPPLCPSPLPGRAWERVSPDVQPPLMDGIAGC